MVPQLEFGVAKEGSLNHANGVGRTAPTFDVTRVTVTVVVDNLLVVGVDPDSGTALSLWSKADYVVDDLDLSVSGSNELGHVFLGLGNESGDVRLVDGGIVFEEVAVVDSTEDSTTFWTWKQHEELAWLGVGWKVRLLESDLIGEVVFDEKDMPSDGNELFVVAVIQEVVLQAGAVDNEIWLAAVAKSVVERLTECSQGVSADADSPLSHLGE